MVIPMEKEFAVSLIKAGTGTSLHLIHVFADDQSPLDAKDYDSYPKGKGTWMEDADEEFPFPNPLRTKKAFEVFEFLISAKKWAQRKVASKDKR